MMQPHVFEINFDVWDALSEEEIGATVRAMHEFGIYQLPFEEIILRICHGDEAGYRQVTEVRGLREGDSFEEQILMYPKKAKNQSGLREYQRFVRGIEAGGHLAVRFTEPRQKTVDLGIHLDGKSVVHRFRVISEADADASQKLFRDGLIVVLASKGTLKCERKNGAAALGIGKRSRTEYVTTIKLAQHLEKHESVKTGVAVRPHLRRGHIRTQHHGPANTLLKRVWVEPCFVNADADFVSKRKAYRVIH